MSPGVTLERNVVRRGPDRVAAIRPFARLAHQLAPALRGPGCVDV